MNQFDILSAISTMPNGRDGPPSALSFDFFCAFFDAPFNDQWVSPRSDEEFDQWCVWCAAAV